MVVIASSAAFEILGLGLVARRRGFGRFSAEAAIRMRVRKRKSPPEQTLDARVEALEANVRYLSDEIDERTKDYESRR